MAMSKALNVYNMSARITERKDNIYKKSVIADILNMYMDEVRKALLRGERIQISKVGTLIPEVKVRKGHCYLPTCQERNDNAPYAKVKIRRNEDMRVAMNQALLNNMEKGIYGLEKKQFDIQQIHILQEYGWIPTEEREEAYIEGIEAGERNEE